MSANEGSSSRAFAATPLAGEDGQGTSSTKWSAGATNRVVTAAKELISTYHEAIEPHRSSLDAKTIWVSLLKYTGKLSKYIGELVDLPKSAYDTFQDEGKYDFILSLNVIIENMVMSLVKSYHPSKFADLDIFLSHAGEQKEKMVNPLSHALSGFRCFYDSESLVAGDTISDEIRDALLGCNVAMVLISKDFVQKRWPLLELFILSARATYHKEQGFKLVVATLSARKEEDYVVSRGWESWFDCVEKLPMPWSSDGMPVAMKLTDGGSSSDVQRLSEGLATAIRDSKERGRKQSEEDFLRARSESTSMELPRSNIPQRKKLVGRQTILEELKIELIPRSRMVALVGPAGMGKSHCAVEVAWRFLDDGTEDRFVLWLRSEQKAGLRVSYLEALSEFGIHVGEESGSLLDLADLLWDFLSKTKFKWLLVFDNVPESIKTENGEVKEGPLAFQSWFFRTPLTNWGHGRILFTTRSDSYRDDTVLGYITPCDLQKLNENEAIRMFRSPGMRKFQWSEEAARKLVTVYLDCMPLAIASASAHVISQRVTVEKYVKKLNLVKVQDKVGAVLQSALDNARDSGLGDILDVVAFVNPDHIQVELLKRSDADDEFIVRLCDLNILRQVDADTFSIHRLHQEAARRGRLPTAAISISAKIAESFDRHNSSNWKLCAKLLPHIETILANHSTQPTGLLASLCYRGGLVSDYAVGDYRGAKRLFKAALIMYREVFGEDAKTDSIADVLHCIGNVCYSLGDYDGAVNNYEEALSMKRDVFGKDAKNASIASTLHVMGSVFDSLGDIEGARNKYEEALAMRRIVFGNDAKKDSIASTLHCIGNVCYRMEDYDGARTKYEEALAMKRVVFGNDAKNDSIASTLHQIGNVSRALGDYEGARNKYNEALEMDFAVFGKDAKNDYIAGTLHAIGTVCFHLHDYEGARSKYNEALTMLYAVFGKDARNASIAKTLYAIGDMYCSCECDYEGARRKMEEALGMYRVSYGADSNHLDIITTLERLVFVCGKHGDDDATEQYQSHLDNLLLVKSGI